MTDNTATRIKAKMKEGVTVKNNVEKNSAFVEEITAFLIFAVIFISLL